MHVFSQNFGPHFGVTVTQNIRFLRTILPFAQWIRFDLPTFARAHG